MTDKRRNPKYAEPQSIYREGVSPEEAIKELLEVKREDIAPDQGKYEGEQPKST